MMEVKSLATSWSSVHAFQGCRLPVKITLMLSVGDAVKGPAGLRRLVFKVACKCEFSVSAAGVF